ncbi:flagellar protein FlaG [Pseudomonas sp. QLc11A]|uniref:Flagellar protein FlaG n=1 Tax=Pseudomonas azerbaijanorientalis TaxID=2842350 RepID=A0ABW8VZF3_9PSED|nr:flagellar biosynthesis protein FlaG [Stutzerimonas stutzeri]AZO89084.1 flagellar biosynthesis protein FlaG [Stutzerimonas stutzeri]
MDMSVKLNLSYSVAQPATPVVEKALEKPRTNVTPVADVEDQSKGSETEQGKLKAAVQEIEKFVQSVKRNLEFSIDEASGQVVVKVIASESGEVVRQIPNEEVLRLANSLNDASSLLFSAEA